MTRYEIDSVETDCGRTSPICTPPSKEPTVEALRQPRPGDMFHEFFTHWVIVIDVTETRVLWVTASGGSVRGSVAEWEPHTASRDAFFARYMYESRASSWVRLSRRDWPVEGLAEKFWPLVAGADELPLCEAVGALEAMEVDPS